MSGSYGLVGYGNQVRQQAMAGLSDMSRQEQEREAANKNLEAAAKAQKFSATGSGAAMGFMIGGPLGALAGGALGYLSTELF